MSLTIVTSTRVIGALHYQPIMIVASGTCLQEKSPEKRSCHESTWNDDTATLIDGMIDENITSTTEPAYAPIITIPPGVPYGIFVDDELVEAFEQVCTDHIGLRIWQAFKSLSETTIEESAASMFDNINPKLTIQTGPIILNDVMEYLWSTPLEIAQMCYVLNREEFVACFLSWLQIQLFLSEIEHNDSQHNRDCGLCSYEHAKNSFKYKRCRVRMPIGRKCCMCQKRNYMDTPYSVCTSAERTDDEEHTCTKCLEPLSQDCDVVFGWF